MRAVSPNWSWQPDRRVRAALNRGDKRYAEWRKELAEKIAEQRREYLARRAST